MNQSKLESGLESFLNMLSGFLISWAMWVYLVQPGYDSGLITSAFMITSIFTVTSLIRSYLWRRYFNNGLHRYTHRVVTAFFGKYLR